MNFDLNILTTFYLSHFLYINLKFSLRTVRLLHSWRDSGSSHKILVAIAAINKKLETEGKGVAGQYGGQCCVESVEGRDCGRGLGLVHGGRFDPNMRSGGNGLEEIYSASLPQ